MSCTIIGVAGGSGSGKTYLARALHQKLGDKISAIIYQDNYYIDQSARFDHDGGSVNFDHPDSLDFDLLAVHLDNLKNGNVIEIPVYDFVTHTRQAKTIKQKPQKVILVDGILLLSQPHVRKHFDISIFVDTTEQLRFERRLKRDVEERGRTPEGVKAQFEKQVKPMHDQFVQPSMEHADHIICDLAGFDLLIEKISDQFKD
ncbi:MAG: uridine kinase [Bdellovibrionales bacterium CG12_big_fil_rev_8_21_14_0_65_38_15]|nr:MAG: uridine kinase [Bdellovibrionales bacterium CG22_combo_CG10-13_8_21_14_all_38_13]PIQ53287.1 MAG: uridine kinase [Bdellovibrionales bacterium CG12_big_fil_rev_8_21_14_0_65_38_15]PIR30352.1 MAG: uridine kinase [Bdellovibrionales bacterium CG11_big_fil_rev_8_21_14_0_20_38_13]